MKIDVKNNSGIAFKNKNLTEKAPNYKGAIKVNNIKYNIGVWVKTSKAGTKYLTFLFAPAIRQPTSAEESFNDAKREQENREIEEDVLF